MVLQSPHKEEVLDLEKPKPTDIDDALDETGFGTYNILLVLTCGLILYGVNSECYSIGYILPAAECDLGLTVAEKSLLTSIGFMGIMSSQFLWGFISDTRGRRNTLIYSLAIAFLCSVFAVFSPWLWLFITFRFLNGVFISCSSATVFAYLGEFVPERYRSCCIMSSCIFVGLALITIPASAWYIINLPIQFNIFNFTFLPWRLFLLINAFPTLLACLALTYFPESPKLLLHVGKSEEALKILSKIYTVNKKRSDFPVKLLKLEEGSSHDGTPIILNIKQVNILHRFYRDFGALFNVKNLKNILLCSTLQFGIFATSSGLLLWYPDILDRLSRSGAEVTVCQAVSSIDSLEIVKVCGGEMDASIFLQNLWVGGVYLVGFILVSIMINYIGIKSIIVTFSAIAGASTAVLYIVTEPNIINVLFIILLVVSGLCVGVVNAAVVNLFPTGLRAMASCVTMFSGRLGSVVSSSVLGYLLEWNCDITLFIYAVNLICCSGLAFMIPPTNRKKTKEVPK